MKEEIIIADNKEVAIGKMVEHMKTHNRRRCTFFFSTEQPIKYLRVRKDIKYNMVLY